MPDLIEQAVYTSAETDRSLGYQVVATSPGVCETDARELAIWCPSHDALLSPAPNAVSYSFHPLPSGNHCISRTTPSGSEYSGRGGFRVYTQCLIVPPKVLLRFGNNPFALLRAALAGGMLRVYDKTPEELPPLRLLGSASAVDEQLLARLAKNPGGKWMAAAIEATLDSVVATLGGNLPAEHLIAGVINCFPIRCRTELSFATGLKFSTQRPFRLMAFSGEADEQRRMERTYSLTVLRMTGTPPPELLPVQGWARLIQRVLDSGKTSYLARRFNDERAAEIELPDLAQLGVEWLDDLEGRSSTSVAPRIDLSDTRRRTRADAAETPGPPRGAVQTEPVEEAAGSVPTHPPRLPAPSATIAPADTEILRKLERLDDLVYETIAGKESAAQELAAYWPKVREELGDELLAESREQYIRYAVTLWQQCASPQGVHPANSAIRSLDVLSILFGGMT
jgi:hypothetical protein